MPQHVPTASNPKPNYTKVQLPFPWNEAITQPIQLDMFTIERGPEIEKPDMLNTDKQTNTNNKTTQQINKHVSQTCHMLQTHFETLHYHVLKKAYIYQT